MATFKLLVEEITFDLDSDDEMSYDDEVNLQALLQEAYTNKTFEIKARDELDAHDELMEIITDTTGWCIYSMTTVPVTL